MEQPIVPVKFILENLGLNTKQESINEPCNWICNCLVPNGFAHIC